MLIRRGGCWREVEGRGAYLGPTDAFFERPRCTSLWFSAHTVDALVGDMDVPGAPITTTAAIYVRHRELVDERLTCLVAALTERAAPGRAATRRHASAPPSARPERATSP